jgi:hypothetical protein
MVPPYIYTGKDTKLDSLLITADISKTTAIILKLVEYLLKQGQTVWIDTFYNFSSLAKTLKIIHRANCVGTLKLTQKNVPIKVKNTEPTKNSGALVCQQTIPTEQRPLVGEVSANFSGYRVSRGQCNGFPWPLISVF